MLLDPRIRIPSTDPDPEQPNQCGYGSTALLLTNRSFLKASSVGAPLYFIDALAGQARILFVKLPYTLATEEAERIGLDHVAR
jgi:COP9 signalosome complex subunit 6